jgi:hypothetical protein
LTHLQSSVEKEGKAELIAVADLTKLRLGQDGPPHRQELDNTRKAVSRLEAQGGVEVEQQPRLITRTVVPAGKGAPREIVEARDVVCCRLMPTIEQMYQEAEAEVARCEGVVASHPGWGFAERELVTAKREAQRLRA